MLDFALPIGLGLVAVLVPLSEVAGWLFPASLAVVMPVSALVLWNRIRRTRVAIDGGDVIVVNVLRSYRIPGTAITKVVTRRAWFGGLYAECYGVRVTGRGRYLSIRSIPLHALSGGETSTDGMYELLTVAVRPKRHGPRPGR
jgi:hypothetical protein